MPYLLSSATTFAVLATLSTIACLALFVKKHRRVAVQTDGRGNATTNAYDSLGRLASVTDPLGATTHYAYDAVGNLASVTNVLGVARVYEYDIRGNKIYEGGGTYPVSYAYDAYSAITNMTTYREGGPGFVPAAYTANNLNQYTSISSSAPSATPCEAFVPQFDLDGNQTLVKTSTGVWQVAYNGENRPVSWTCGTTNIVMSFDRMGRRTEYIETVDGVTNSHVSFVYDGYLQIANTDAVAETEQRFVWDPTEPVATRPFVLYSGVGTQLYLFAVERCCIEKYANSDDCNCCMRSKATVIARVFWQANNYQFVINEVSAQRKKRMDMTLHRLVDGKTFLLPCKQHKEDHGIKRGKEVMPSTVELKFPPDSIYSR